MGNKIASLVILLLLLLFVGQQVYLSEMSFLDIAPQTLTKENLDQTQDQEILTLLNSKDFRRSLRALDKLVDKDKTYTIKVHEDELILYDNGIISINDSYYLIVFESAKDASLYEETLKSLQNQKEMQEHSSEKDTLLFFNYMNEMIMTHSEEESNTLDIDYHYMPLENINTDLIDQKTATIDLEDFQLPLTRPFKESYLVAFEKNDKASLYYEGESSFKSDFPYDMSEKSLKALLVDENNTIYLIVSDWPQASFGNPNGENTILVALDERGNIIKETFFEDPSASLFKHVFVTENNTLLCVGETLKNGKSDVSLLEVSGEGDILFQKTFGGSDFDYCLEADYFLGSLYISGFTNSTDGDLILEKTGDKHTNYLMSLRKDGSLNWLQNTELRYSNICILEENRILLKQGYDDTDTVYVMNQSGSFIEEIDVPLSSNATFTRTSDGGIYLSLQRPVKTLPQPLFISSIWTDSEAVCIKYDKDFNLMWRLSSNRYEDYRLEPIYILK